MKKRRRGRNVCERNKENGRMQWQKLRKNLTQDETESEIEGISNEKVREKERERRLQVGRARSVKDRKKYRHRERAREGGWMLSCIDPSSPPSVTSLTYPTSNGDDTVVLRSQATDLTLEPFIQRLRRRYLFRGAGIPSTVRHIVLSSTSPKHN